MKFKVGDKVAWVGNPKKYQGTILYIKRDGVYFVAWSDNNRTSMFDVDLMLVHEGNDILKNML